MNREVYSISLVLLVPTGTFSQWLAYATQQVVFLMPIGWLGDYAE